MALRTGCVLYQCMRPYKRRNPIKLYTVHSMGLVVYDIIFVMLYSVKHNIWTYPGKVYTVVRHVLHTRTRVMTRITHV
jgi:hypothetical protein